jgi:hypothetical protein
VEWQVNDGSTMSSITFNGNDITPTNAAQNNVTITVTADNQSLVINNIAPKELNDLLSVKVTVAAFSGNIDFVDKDSNSLGTIRVTGTNLEGQEIKFNISDHAPISIIFYDEQPTLVLVNDETIALDHTAQDESEDGDGEDNSGSLANETVRYYYVVAADKLVSGTNTVDISMDALSGINSILADGLSNDVYNLQGICVLRQANKAQLRQLPAGLYIMNGKKIAIK